MKVIYIAGYGRSGSTLLDVMLSSIPEVFGAGELMSLFSAWSRGNLCSCGQALTECDVWSQVMELVSSRIPDFSISRSESVTRSVEKIAVRPDIKIIQEYKSLWGAVLDSIVEVTGSNTLVDSSKTAYAATGRASILASMSGINMSVVHLVRDPRAVIWSRIRGLKPDVRTGRSIPSTVGPMRTAIGWTVANIMAQNIDRKNGISKALVRYEDLVKAPNDVLSLIGEVSHIDVQEVIETIRESRPIECGHGVGGNPMRGTSVIKVREDTEWRQALPRYGKIVASLTWPMARRYGYHW